MSTSCSITIFGENKAAVFMSHDGSPDTVLPVLVKALSEYGKRLTSKQLYKTYLAQYSAKGSRQLVDERSLISDLMIGDWDYVINNGTLEVRCYRGGAEAGEALIHPLSYVFQCAVRRSCQADVVRSIYQTLETLEFLGVSLSKLED